MSFQIIRNKDKFPVSIQGVHGIGRPRQFSMPFEDIGLANEIHEGLLIKSDGRNYHVIAGADSIKEFFEALAEFRAGVSA